MKTHAPAIDVPTSSVMTREVEVHHESDAGLPQLDSSTFASQLFWLALCFIALYVLMAKRLAPRIQDVLDMRSGKIASDIDRATSLREESERVKSLYEKALAEARSETQVLIAAATENVKQQATHAAQQLDKTLSRSFAEAMAAIDKARQKATADIMPHLSELTALIVEKLVHQKPTDAEVKAAIASAIKQQDHP